MNTKLIRHFRELDVYQNGIDLSMRLLKISKDFPAEAWRKRRYKAAFISKLNDAETEATETQVWCEMAYLCEYIDKKTFPRIGGRWPTNKA